MGSVCVRADDAESQGDFAVLKGGIEGLRLRNWKWRIGIEGLEIGDGEMWDGIEIKGLALILQGRDNSPSQVSSVEPGIELCSQRSRPELSLAQGTPNFTSPALLPHVLPCTQRNL